MTAQSASHVDVAIGAQAHARSKPPRKKKIGKIWKHHTLLSFKIYSISMKEQDEIYNHGWTENSDVRALLSLIDETLPLSLREVL